RRGQCVLAYVRPALGLHGAASCRTSSGSMHLPAATREPGPYPVTYLAAGRDSCGAVGIVHKTGPLARFLTEQPSVWRPHVEEDPFGHAGRVPADCRGPRALCASG